MGNAVGTALTGSPPYRSGLEELPHPAPASGPNAKALVWVWMYNTGFWYPLGSVFIHLFPRQFDTLLTSSSQGEEPSPNEFGSEVIDCFSVSGDTVVVHVSVHHRTQPSSLIWKGDVSPCHSSSSLDVR